MGVSGGAKVLIKRLIQAVGYDVQHYDPVSDPNEKWLRRFLSRQDFGLVFDVGANTGQFAQELRHLGYRRRIVSFEPLTQAFAELRRNAEGDPLWEAEKAAIGARDGTTEICVSGNLLSSSILAMLPRHLEAAPQSAFVGKEQVQIRTLDSIVGERRCEGEKIFLKIDTQGYEKAVLEGARTILCCVAAVMMEMSLTPLYEGETLFPDMLRHMRDRGFVLVRVETAFADPASGEILQVNGYFVNTYRLGDAQDTRPAVGG
jgi:FkbM family methyltransferase